MGGLRMPRKAARQIGAENLTKPDVEALISRQLKERAARNDIDADFVIERITSELDADLADLFNPNRAIGIRPIGQRFGDKA